jgi:hypothetical protein
VSTKPGALQGGHLVTASSSVVSRLWGYVIESVTLVVWMRLPLEPVIVIVARVRTALEAETVKVEDVVAGLGENEPLTLLGRPLALNAT